MTKRSQGGGRPARGGGREGGRDRAARRPFEQPRRGAASTGERGDRGDNPRGRQGAYGGSRTGAAVRRSVERPRNEVSERGAVRRAAAVRPEGGWSLDDFDDIPMPRSSRARQSGPPVTSVATPETGNAHRAPRPADAADDGTVRLQKALANAGIASRRASEQLIERGRVEVNGRVVTELGSRINPEVDRVAVDGVAVQFDTTMRYVILNKPVGVVSSMKDEQGRPDLRRFTREFPERLYNVGRLDAETSGLLILTNDGELANVLAHPSYGVEKTYIAKVRGRVAPGTLQQLKRGIELEDGPIHIDAGKILAGQSTKDATLVEVTLHSGRNRIVRRMFAAVGHPVTDLVRRSFGPLHLGSLKAGEMREVTPDEVRKLVTLSRRAAKRPERTEGMEGAERTGRTEQASEPATRPPRSAHPAEPRHRPNRANPADPARGGRS